ncbi:hypothetical protein OROHE_026953 [Orobanche hederae]
MEDAFELEDDVFFKDLNKQISLLIMDDDDDENSLLHFQSLNFKRASKSENNGTGVFIPHPPSKRELIGTGVFIPYPSHTRRKNVKGRKKIHRSRRGLVNMIKTQIRPS